MEKPDRAQMEINDLKCECLVEAAKELKWESTIQTIQGQYHPWNLPWSKWGGREKRAEKRMQEEEAMDAEHTIIPIYFF